MTLFFLLFSKLFRYKYSKYSDINTCMRLKNVTYNHLIFYLIDFLYFLFISDYLHFNVATVLAPPDFCLHW